jgi:hypothetical protein
MNLFLLQVETGNISRLLQEAYAFNVRGASRAVRLECFLFPVVYVHSTRK